MQGGSLLVGCTVCLVVISEGWALVLLFLFPELLFFIMHVNGCSVFSAEKQICLSQLQNSKARAGCFLQTSHGHCIECDFLSAHLFPSQGNLSGLAAKAVCC